MTGYLRAALTETANLIGAWRMNDADGAAAAVDSSGNGYDGTPTDVTFAGGTALDGDLAATFNGTSSYIDLDDAGLLAAADGAELTLIVWLDPDDWSDATARVACRFTDDSSNLFLIRRNGANTLSWQSNAGGTVKEITKSGLSPSGPVCAALTVSETSDEVKAYYDGELVGTLTGLGTFAGAIVSANIGANTSGGAFWDGQLENVLLWDKALTGSQIAYITSGSSVTTPDAAIGVYIDFDADGFFANDIVIQDVRNGAASIGILSEEARIAEIGQLTLTLDNSERQYTPGNASGPYYGKLTPKTPVRITGWGDTGETALWTGFIVAVLPQSQRYGSRYCDIVCHDRMREYQGNKDIVLPVQTDAIADDLLRLVDAATYQSDAATGTITATDLATDGDTITLGDTTYTIKDTLTPAEGEVKNFSDRYNTQPTAANHYYIDDTIENIVAAINHQDSASNTYYADATPRHAQVVASVDHPAFGWPLSKRDAYMYLANSGSGSYTQMACLITLPGDVIENVLTIRLPLAKVGAPTGTLTISIVEQGGDTFPTAVLVDTNATITRAESSLPLSTSPDVMTEITFPDSFTIPENAMVVVSTDTTPNGTNYVRWGSEAAGSSYRGGAYTYAGSWASSASNLIFWSNATVTLYANARGSRGNAVALASSGNIAVSGAYLTGGAQPTTFTPDYEVGVQTFEYAGDAWGEGVNAMTALQEIADSELGFFVIGRDGNPVFKNMNTWFKAHTQTRLAIDNTQAEFDLRYTLDDVRNMYTIDYRQRSIVEGVTIGKGPKVIKLLPGAGVAYNGGRWGGWQDREAAGYSKTFTISTVDGDTGEPAGVYAVDPPVLGTHYTLNTKLRKELGNDVTNPGYVKTSWAIKGAAVDLTVTNVSGQLLWMHDTYLSGDVLDWSQPMQFYTEDATSIAAYGIAPGAATLWLPTGEPFATALGEYLLALHKDPRTIASTLRFNLLEYAALSHLFMVDLFDVLGVQEYQTAFDHPCMVTGIEYTFDAARLTEVVFYLRQLDPVEYIIFDDTTYGRLDGGYAIAL